MDESVKILCVDDEPNVLKALRRLFMDEDYEIFTAASGEEGLAIMTEQWDIQVVLSDYRMPGVNGVDFLKAVHDGWPDTIRIVLSGYADTASVVAAINEGQIYKFIGKPWNDEELKETIAQAIEYYRLERKNQALTRELQASNAELRLHNEALGKLVVDRTAELVFENQQLRLGRQILDWLPVAAAAVDESGFVVQGNRCFADLIGQDPGSLMGEDIAQLLSVEVAEFIREIPDGQIGAGCFDLRGNSCRIKGARMAAGADLAGVVLVIDTIAP